MWGWATCAWARAPPPCPGVRRSASSSPPSCTSAPTAAPSTCSTSPPRACTSRTCASCSRCSGEIGRASCRERGEHEEEARSSRRRHTRWPRDWSSDVCSSDLVGLGYVRLGQSATTLSGGEAQRVKLASELHKRSNGRTIYVLDEPTTGLHFEDVRKLLEVLGGLVDKGNTVLVIEHNLDVIKTADHIIDLGPEGGAGGGQIVATGTPEQVASVKDSYTGQFLAPMLEKGRR